LTLLAGTPATDGSLREVGGAAWLWTKDPLIEYKSEGYDLFLDMMTNIRRNVVYSVPVPTSAPAIVASAVGVGLKPYLQTPEVWIGRVRPNAFAPSGLPAFKSQNCALPDGGQHFF